MEDRKIVKIDFSLRRLKNEARKRCEEGDFRSALRLLHRLIDEYGEDGDTLVMLADIYESMRLHSSAINQWFRFLDGCSVEDFPEAYEGLAVNFLAQGDDRASAYYYKRLMDAEDVLTSEEKREVIEMIDLKEKSFRFVYPPQLADYTKETKKGSLALKNGDLKGAIECLSSVENGSKEYAKAKEIEAVAYLMSGDFASAENSCLSGLQEDENNVPLLATLSAVYTEQNRKEESLQIALTLNEMPLKTREERFKVATVACENELHAEAFEHFLALDKEVPNDGKTLYFKAVSAYKSGKLESAIDALENLCEVYPDSEVAKYYLRKLRLWRDGASEKAPELSYFYQLPVKEKKRRMQELIALEKMPRAEAEIVGSFLAKEGYFTWCFDELDGMENDLQYFAVLAADRARLDDFLRNVLLDDEVSDYFKVEVLYLLFLRNESNDFGVVFCHIYKELETEKVALGVRKRRSFLQAYASCASKFAIVEETYGEKIRKTTESLYRTFKEKECWELAENVDDLVCAIYLLSGLKELGTSLQKVAPLLDADEATVDLIMAKHLSN